MEAFRCCELCCCQYEVKERTDDLFEGTHLSLELSHEPKNELIVEKACHLIDILYEEEKEASNKILDWFD